MRIKSGDHAGRRQIMAALTIAAMSMVVLTIVQDSLCAGINKTSFFLSESFLFSSFWWMFVPGLYYQNVLLEKIRKTRSNYLLQILVPGLAHFLAFPATVWILSGALMDHRFEYAQTFQFAVSTYLYIVILFYTLPVVAHAYFFEKGRALKSTSVTKPLSRSADSIFVTEGRKHVQVKTSDILFVRANPPYVDIHLPSKRFLNSGSLKELILHLDEEQFMRVHRSAIINLKEVSSVTSRSNGDYDLMMSNGEPIRLSRKYASEFKFRVSILDLNH